MKRKNILLLAMLLGVSAMLRAQDYKRIADSMKGAKFSDIITEIEKQFEGNKHSKHSGYKQYSRWKNYNQTRLTPDGYLQNVTALNFEQYHKQVKASQLKSTDYFQGNWESLGVNTFTSIMDMNTNGRVNCVAVDPSNSEIIYVGTPGGGLWRTENNGESWMPLTDGMTRIGVSGIVIDPNSPPENRIIYILTGDYDGSSSNCIGVLKSYDNGLSWKSTGLQFQYYSDANGAKIVMHPSNYSMLFVATKYGIHKTTDGGLNWSIKQNGRFTDIEFNTGDPNLMYASTRDGKFYISEDGGNKWDSIAIGLPKNNSSRTGIGVTPADPDYVYVLFGDNPDSVKHFELFLSEDGGKTFTPKINTGNIFYGRSWFHFAITVSPENRDELYIGGILLYKSTDGGETLEQMRGYTRNFPHVDIHALEFNDKDLFVASDGGVNVYRYLNIGKYWKDISSNLEISEYVSLDISRSDPDLLLVAAQDNGIQRIQEKTSWMFDGGDGKACLFDPTNDQIIYSSDQTGTLNRSENSGENLKNITPDNEKGSHLLVMDPLNNEVLWIGYRDIYKSTNKGDTWENKTKPPFGDGYVKSIAIAPSDPNCVYVSKTGCLYRTLDGGNTWNVQFDSDNEKVGRTIVHPSNKDIIYVASFNKVWKSTDGGKTYSSIKYDLPNVSYNCLVYEEGSNDRIYLGTDMGVYYLDNNVNKWQEFSNGLIPIEITDMKINYSINKIYISTYGRGIWKSDLANNCPETLELKTTNFGNRVYQAKEIVSTATILPGTSISYLATDKITLAKGFRAWPNSGFTAKIIDETDCGSYGIDLKNTHKKELTGYYAGPMPGIIENKDDQISEGNNLIADNFSFYPNPASSSITFSFAVSSEQPVNIVIMDILGSVKEIIVDNEPLSKGVYELTHNLNNLDEGMYIINYSNGAKKSTKQLIITK